jgi:LysM repeat protein
MLTSSLGKFALLASVGVVVSGVRAAQPKVEPGLETAVRWIWEVQPSPGAGWMFARTVLPMPVVPAVPMNPGAPGAPTALPAGRPDTYTIQRGDALIIISRKFKVPVELLKEVNGLTSNVIRAGDVLRIPSLAEVQARAPVPTPKPLATAKPGAKSSAPAGADLLTLQVFLDRERFSVGPIDGQNSPTFQKILRIYQAAHPETQDPAVLSQKAHAAVAEPLGRYTLRPEDFRFIAPPKAELASAVATPTPTPSKKRKAPPAPVVIQARPAYKELVESPMLAYRTPWEFVAEKFHCSEAYLRAINAEIRDVPTVGTELRVPNVAPFVIERALQEPLQPPADPQSPVTAAVVDLSVLQISKAGTVIAAMPLSIARPGLRGRDPWTVLGPIPRPQLSTMQELRVKPQPPTRIYGRESDPTPTPTPRPLVHQTLAAGPNNPVGVLWINLARAGSTEPLPYGLHGTSIPDYMENQESLGGLRLTNWDVVRAVRLLPPGTVLEWMQGPALPANAPTAVAQPAG